MNHHEENEGDQTRKRKNSRSMISYSSSSSIQCATRNTNRAAEAQEQDPIEEAAAMILSRIDSESYEKAVLFDTERILQNHVFPRSFVWNKPRIQLLRTLPRDIEDMPGILHAGGISPFYKPSTNYGPLGYGMFDMGGLRRDEVRGTRTETVFTPRSRSSPGYIGLSKSIGEEKGEDSNDTFDSESDYPLKCCLDYEAAARRSSDPGIIELAVKLPPLKLEPALLSCQQHGILPRDPWLKHNFESVKKVKALIAAERAEISSSMPLYLEKLDKESHFHPPVFLPSDEDGTNKEKLEIKFQTCLDSVGVTSTDKEAIYEVSKLRKNRKLKCTKLARTGFRKWRLSVKVGGVSSRQSLIKNLNKGIKPMHLVASFPTYIQTGKSVTLEAAQKMDEESNYYLGSYDCRASAPHASMSFQAMRNHKKDARTKKTINVGRTRLIWSSFHQANNNKIVCTSDLTGDKLYAVSSKRPIEVSVFIRLNGKLLSIVESRRTDPVKDNIDNLFKQKCKWSEQNIRNAIERTNNKNDIIPDLKSTLTLDNKNNAYCTFHIEDFLKDLRRKLRRSVASKKRKFNAPPDVIINPGLEAMKFGCTYDLKFNAPKFSCLPLDDGYVRVICEKLGCMKPSPVHELLRSAANEFCQSNGKLCSVCWCGDNDYDEYGDKPLKVVSCYECGLNVHLDCCADSGEIVSPVPSEQQVWNGKRFSWLCSICKASRLGSLDAELQSNSNDLEDQTSLPSRKSRRTSRLPTRFTENTEVESNLLLRQANKQTNNQASANNSTKPKSRPSPKCTLCPHSGGAMSLLGGSSNGNKWIHEICRIWCQKRSKQEVIGQKHTLSAKNSLKNSIIPPNSPSGPDMNYGDIGLQDIKSSPVTPVCCICGKGEVLQSKNQQIKGLIKCAATGCHVMFHPMCAVLATKLRIKGSSIEKVSSPPLSTNMRQATKDGYAILKDIDLCKDFTLELLELKHEKIREASKGGERDTLFIARGDESSNHDKEMEYSIVPVGFCGIHNPKRHETFYGCTPGAKVMSDYIRVPFSNHEP